MNLVKGKVVAGDDAIAFADGSQIRLSTLERPLAPGEEVTIGIRPEHMAVGSAGLVPLTGTVDVVERLGEASYVYMHLADGTNVTLRIPGDSAVSPARRDGQRRRRGGMFDAGALPSPISPPS
jgi:ABC-type sugar transport system ATPase subunit